MYYPTRDKLHLSKVIKLNLLEAITNIKRSSLTRSLICSPFPSFNLLLIIDPIVYPIVIVYPMVIIYPGMEGGPTCECSSYYFKSEERLAELIALWKLRDTSFLDALEFDDRVKAIQMMCSRMAFDGEMASSGTRATSVIHLPILSTLLYSTLLYSTSLHSNPNIFPTLPESHHNHSFSLPNPISNSYPFRCCDGPLVLGRPRCHRTIVPKGHL